MAKRIQLRRGTTAQSQTFTGAVAEVTVDTDKKTLVVHDGSTVGGWPVAARANTDGTISLINKAGTVLATIASAGLLNNTLTSTATNQALTAAQGKALQDNKYDKAGGTISGDVAVTGGLGLTNTSTTTGVGLSLHGGAKAGMPQYGVAFSGTATFGTHGSVVGDWATYFTITGATNRGWIFKTGSTASGNVASISATGVVTASKFVGDFQGTLTGNASSATTATTATTLANTRTINGVGFNGSANITIADSTKLPLSGGTVTGQLKITSTMPAGSKTTGALVVSGGVGIGGDLFTGAAITAANNITAYSDIRVKSNIRYVTNAAAKVSKLNGITYTRNDQEDKTTRYIGLIAQEVQKVVPEAVRVMQDDRKTLTVDYQGLVGLLVEAVKELSERVKVLEGE